MAILTPAPHSLWLGAGSVVDVRNRIVLLQNLWMSFSASRISWFFWCQIQLILMLAVLAENKLETLRDRKRVFPQNREQFRNFHAKVFSVSKILLTSPNKTPFTIRSCALVAASMVEAQSLQRNAGLNKNANSREKLPLWLMVNDANTSQKVWNGESCKNSAGRSFLFEQSWFSKISCGCSALFLKFVDVNL